jgi:hypothetical protein
MRGPTSGWACVGDPSLVLIKMSHPMRPNVDNNTETTVRSHTTYVDIALTHCEQGIEYTDDTYHAALVYTHW